MTLGNRFWTKVQKLNGGCWLWIAGKQLGYGRFSFEGRTWQAHRLAYIEAIGPIPAGKQIDHLCRTPACVNPAHLEVVTIKQNVLRGMSPTAQNSRKINCKNGHPLSGDNLYRYSDGRRQCRICLSAWRSKRRSAKP